MVTPQKALSQGQKQH